MKNCKRTLTVKGQIELLFFFVKGVIMFLMGHKCFTSLPVARAVIMITPQSDEFSTTANYTYHSHGELPHVISTTRYSPMLKQTCCICMLNVRIGMTDIVNKRQNVTS